MQQQHRSNRRSAAVPVDGAAQPPEDVRARSTEDVRAQSTEDVARRAYEKYCERGCEDGHDMEDWLSAEREVNGQDARNASRGTE
jgi:hypothetical protein